MFEHLDLIFGLIGVSVVAYTLIRGWADERRTEKDLEKILY